MPIFPMHVGALSNAIEFDTDYQAYLDYGTSQAYTLPSAGQQVLQNQLVLDLKSAGAWDVLDTFYIFANDGGEDMALVNLVDPDGAYSGTNGAGLTHTANAGFVGNDANVIQLGGDLTAATNFDNTAKTGHLAAWVTATNSPSNGDGIMGGVANRFSIDITAGVWRGTLFGARPTSSEALVGDSFYIVSQDASICEMWRNGTSKQTATRGTLTNTAAWYACGCNGSPSPITQGIAASGGDVNDIIADYNSAVQTYMAAI